MHLATLTLTAVNNTVSDAANAVTNSLGLAIPYALGVAALAWASVLTWRFFKAMIDDREAERWNREWQEEEEKKSRDPFATSK